MNETPQFNLNAPSHIFIGQLQYLKEVTAKIIQQIYCPSSCDKCPNCLKIKNNNHENILWLKPEKQYNLEQIDLILQKISYLQQQDKFFVIFQQADLLTSSCSNRLLKSIEEPGDGYYFIFLTERPNLILSTIYSRCIVTNFNNNIKEFINDHEIGKFFVNFNNDPTEFLKIIEKTNINEHESIELLDNLIHYWASITKQYLIDDNKRKYDVAYKVLSILSNDFKSSIMPGSSKLFWRNLFLKLNIVL